jgi:hypothetical protein
MRLWPKRNFLNDPIFIVGCGRSGTTALGEVIGRHPQVAYLNEPRRIWALEPRTDIWTKQARERGGRLVLDADDVDLAIGRKIAKAFAREVQAQSATRLVEKLPINTFRIGFVRAIFPDAKFVHLIRNGIEVAQSIARLAQVRDWFGRDDYKWEQLQEYARAEGREALLAWCTDDFTRGLLEWRLSVGAARRALRTLPAESSIEIRYEEMITQPETICGKLETFSGLEPNEAMRRYAREELARKSTPAKMTLTPAARAIALDLLIELGYAVA